MGRLVPIFAADQALVDQLCELVRALYGNGISLARLDELSVQQKELLHRIVTPAPWEKK